MIKKIILIKDLNRTRILKYIWDNAPIDRARISKELGLSKTTLTIVVKELIENKILEETGRGDSTREGGKETHSAKLQGRYRLYCRNHCRDKEN